MFIIVYRLSLLMLLKTNGYLTFAKQWCGVQECCDNVEKGNCAPEVSVNIGIWIWEKRILRKYFISRMFRYKLHLFVKNYV